jgi:uncharacterized protein
MTGPKPQDATPANDNGGTAPERKKPCAICGKPATAQYNPFCSARCADVDLNRWLGGVYAVPAREEDDDENFPSDV